jgi:hypothetical protein
MQTQRSYSQLDLLSDELSKLQNTTFLDRILDILTNSKHVYLKITLPTNIVVRANVLCEDIMIEGNLEKKFTISHLGSILFDDFLKAIRKDENFDMLYQKLNVSYSKKMSNEEEDQIGYTEVTIRLERKDALRGEVLLCDLANYYPNHTFMLESLLELIIVDFVQEYLKGNVRQPIKNILLKIDTNPEYI